MERISWQRLPGLLEPNKDPLPHLYRKMLCIIGHDIMVSICNRVIGRAVEKDLICHINEHDRPRPAGAPDSSSSP